MFKKKEEVNFDKVETLLGRETAFEGVIKSSGTVRIDGKFSGQIFTQGDLVIGEEGLAKATINARNVLIAGIVEGNITAEGKVEITPTGKVIGDMNVAKLIIDEGAVFKGNCLMEAPKKEITENQKQ